VRGLRGKGVRHGGTEARRDEVGGGFAIGTLA
jgi:hypothetical protein